MKAMTASEKHLEKEVCLLQNETTLLLKIKEKLMRRYGDQKTVVRRSVA